MGRFRGCGKRSWSKDALDGGAFPGRGSRNVFLQEPLLSVARRRRCLPFPDLPRLRSRGEAKGSGAKLRASRHSRHSSLWAGCDHGSAATPHFPRLRGSGLSRSLPSARRLLRHHRLRPRHVRSSFPRRDARGMPEVPLPLPREIESALRLPQRPGRGGGRLALGAEAGDGERPEVARQAPSSLVFGEQRAEVRHKEV